MLEGKQPVCLVSAGWEVRTEVSNTCQWYFSSMQHFDMDSLSGGTLGNPWVSRLWWSDWDLA